MGGDRGSYTIGELAERAGVSTSALRYYDRRGLVTPVGRSAGGYRLFDDDSLTRLRFIARAKGLGCSLDEIHDLLTLVDGDDCGPAQARLRGLVTTRIDEARRRSADLAGFAAQLQVAARALDRDPVDGPCRPECACLDPDPVTDDRSEAPAIACTLPADDLDDRIRDWRELLAAVVDRTTIDGGVRLSFGPAVATDELLRLTVAERSCCAFFAFAITVDDRGLALEVRAPGDGADVVDALFGAAA